MCSWHDQVGDGCTGCCCSAGLPFRSRSSHISFSQVKRSTALSGRGQVHCSGRPTELQLTSGHTQCSVTLGTRDMWLPLLESYCSDSIETLRAQDAKARSTQRDLKRLGQSLASSSTLDCFRVSNLFQKTSDVFLELSHSWAAPYCRKAGNRPCHFCT